MKPQAIRYQAAATPEGVARMDLMGEVGWEIEPAGVSKALQALGGQAVDVSIHSFGGDALAGIAIHNMLAKYPGKKRMTVEGLAASAASLIAMAGDEIIIPANAFLMIHEAWGGTWGTAGEMRDQANVLEAISAAYRDTYAKRSGQAPEAVAELMAAETWMRGDEAVAMGFATGIGEPIDAKAMARLGPIPAGRFQRVPAALTELDAPEPEPEAVEAAPAAEEEPAEAPAPEAAAEPEPAEPAEPKAPEAAVGTLSASLSVAPVEMTLPTDQAIEAARKAERDRQASIRGMLGMAVANGRISSDSATALADKLCNDGVELEAARAQVMEVVMGPAAGVAGRGLTDHGSGNVGLDTKELQAYSVLNVVRYLADPTLENREKIGLELEASRAAEQLPSQKPSDGGILIPLDVLRSPINGGWGGMRPRALQNVTEFGAGGALVDTTYLTGSFIEAVYRKSAIMRTGMTMLTGLVGNVSIGKQISGSSVFWVGETTDVNESELGFGLTGLSPKTIGVRVPFSRLSLKQTTPDIEMLARRDMVTRMALGIDESFLYGTGSEFQPLGLCRHPGLAGITLGGGASIAYSAKLGGGTHDTGDWADYVAMETAIASEELDVESMLFLLNSGTRGGCKTTLRSNVAGADYIMRDNGTINGYGTIVSNQLRQNDVVFGNFADAMGGMWGAIDLIVDPYTRSASGQVVITMHQDVDFAVRYLESFALAS